MINKQGWDSFTAPSRAARTAPRRRLNGESSQKVRKLESDYRKFLQGKRNGRFAAQKPKVGGEYFPVSEELGIQSPRDTQTLVTKMNALEDADPFWARSASDVRGRDVQILIRGEPRNKDSVINRRILSAIASETPGIRQLGEGSVRMWLAGQIANAENPLTARVWVNRLWHHLFGRVVRNLIA